MDQPVSISNALCWSRTAIALRHTQREVMLGVVLIWDLLLPRLTHTAFKRIREMPRRLIEHGLCMSTNIRPERIAPRCTTPRGLPRKAGCLK